LTIGLEQQTEQSLPIRRRRVAGSSRAVGESGGVVGAEGSRAWMWLQRRSSIPEERGGGASGDELHGGDKEWEEES
jgi:hypothetical protein